MRSPFLSSASPMDPYRCCSRRRRQYQNPTPAATSASSPNTPPRTPPTIALTCDFVLPVAAVGVGFPVEVEEVEEDVLVPGEVLVEAILISLDGRVALNFTGTSLFFTNISSNLGRKSGGERALTAVVSSCQRSYFGASLVAAAKVMLHGWLEKPTRTMAKTCHCGVFQALLQCLARSRFS